MSYRNIRHCGLLTLFLIILAISLFSYTIANRSAQRLTYSIAVEKARLEWKALDQLVNDSRESFYAFRLGKTSDISEVILPLERAQKRIEKIRKTIINQSELKAVNDIAREIIILKSAILSYAKSPQDGDSLEQAQEAVLSISSNITQTIQVVTNSMVSRINEKNLIIVKETYYFQKILGLALILSIIAVLTIALWMGASLAKPIKELEAATERIAKGDLGTSVKVSSKDEIGQLFSSFNQMIEELKQSRSQLIEKTYLDSIITNMIDSLVVMNTQAQITMVNKATCELLGYSQEELIGKDAGLIFAGEYEFREKILSAFRSQGAVENYETRYRRKDNSSIPMLFSGSVLKDTKNREIGFLAVSRDITERKELEKKYRLAQLGKLVADMAHEVNNPLMVISGRAELSLMQSLGDEKLKNNLRIIVDYCQRAKEIIIRLLQFSRPSKGELKEVYIHNCIEEITSIIEHQFELANITIEKNYAQNLKPLLIDEKQIQEVLMNLLNNSRDAMEEGGKIQINTSLEDDFIKIEIKDNGRGIERAVLDKIFDPFFTTKDKGTGLGIPLCYNIIKNYGGDLRFSSEINKGTTATIILPTKKG